MSRIAKVGASNLRPALWIPLTIGAGLAAAHYLPPNGPALVLKLAIATYAVLFLPGVAILRLLGLPNSLPLIAAASLAWGLLAIFAALALTFLVDGSLRFTIAALAVMSLSAVIAGRWRRRTADQADEAVPAGRNDLRVALVVLGAGVIFGFVVWSALPAVTGDGLDHLSRARKLAEFDVLDSVAVADQYRGGGLDPGYAFPLWHAFLALVARLTRVDVGDVVRYLPPVLCPLSLLLLYGAGATLFRSWTGGALVAIIEVARLGFAFAPAKRIPGVGWFAYLSWPGQASILLLVPAILGLIFAFISSGTRTLLISVGAAAFVLAVIHPTYALFIAVPVLGFLAAQAWLSPGGRVVRRRLAASLGVVALSSGLFFVWLLPVLTTAMFFQGGLYAQSNALLAYRETIQAFSESSFRIAPNFVLSGSGGAASAAALLAIPAAVLNFRRPWAGYVLGGSLAVLAVVLIPPIFSTLSGLVSVGQLRRLAPFFLPWAFALAGGALFLSRLRWAAVGVAVGLGIALHMLFPTIWNREAPQTTAAWPVWFAVVAGTAALLVGRFMARRLGERPGDEARPADTGIQEFQDGSRPQWAILVGVALVAPIVSSGLSDLRYVEDTRPLTPGLIRALRDHVKERQVVFSTTRASYRIQAYVPVYVAAVLEGHARATTENRHLERIADVTYFFSPHTRRAECRRILNKYDADWIVVSKRERRPWRFLLELEPLYEDERYTLYRWDAATAASDRTSRPSSSSSSEITSGMR